MSMNIAKLQAQLQHVPDQALIGYVQNPDGQVPSYLALAELTRRKEIRSEGVPHQLPTKQPSIAEQTIASHDPGVAGLQIPDDMYSEKSMAAGGIIAFDEGGDVKHFAKGGFQGAYTDYQNYVNDPDKYDPNAVSSSWDRFMSESPEAAYARAKQKELYRLYDVTGTPAPGKWTASSISPKPGIFEQTTPAQREAYKQRDDLIRNFAAGQYDPTKKADVNSPVAEPEVNTEVPPKKPVPPKVPGGNPKAVIPPSAADAGIGTLTYKGPEDVSGQYDTMLRPDESAQAAMQKYKGLIGIDPNQQKMQDRLAAMEAKTAKDEEIAPWMALAKAGFGMAGGKSQYALQNLAEGAGAGIADLAASKDKIANAREKQFDISSRLAAADRAEQVAAATYGLNSEEATKAHNERVRLSKLGYKADLATANAKGEFDAQKGNLERDMGVAKMAEESRWHKLQYDADMARTGVMGANAQFTKEQAQATNLLKQIMAPKIAALKNAGYAEEDAYDAVFPQALSKLPPNMLDALGYTSDYVKGMGTPTADSYIKKYGLTPKTTK
jgi:hypothetical protein